MANTTQLKPEIVETPPTIVPQGMVAVLWNPRNDNVFKLAATIGNATPIRPFSYTLLNGYAKQPDGREIPDMDVFTLKFVGLNWVKAAEWEEVKRQSKERDKFVPRLMQSGAIKEFTPIAKVLSGTLMDYGDDDAIEMVDYIFDVDVLSSHAKQDNRAAITAHIKQRIEGIQAGEII